MRAGLLQIGLAYGSLGMSWRILVAEKDSKRELKTDEFLHAKCPSEQSDWFLAIASFPD